PTRNPSSPRSGPTRARSPTPTCSRPCSESRRKRRTEVEFRYSRWDERLTRNLDFLRNLLSLYNRLLLMTDGNVDEALRALEELGERFGFFNSEFTPEDFRKHLLESEAVQEVNGKHVLTRRGERMIRQDSLDRIFTALAKDSTGDHRVHRTGAGGDRTTETRPYV